MALMQALPSEGFVRIGQIIKPSGVLPLGRTRWYQGIASGEFPRPKKIGSASLWEVQDIRELLSAVASGKFHEVPR